MWKELQCLCSFLAADRYVFLNPCTNFDQARLDRRFEVVDEEIVSICSKFSRSEFQVDSFSSLKKVVYLGVP